MEKLDLNNELTTNIQLHVEPKLTNRWILNIENIHQFQIQRVECEINNGFLKKSRLYVSLFETIEDSLFKTFNNKKLGDVELYFLDVTGVKLNSFVFENCKVKKIQLPVLDYSSNDILIIDMILESKKVIIK